MHSSSRTRFYRVLLFIFLGFAVYNLLCTQETEDETIARSKCRGKCKKNNIKLPDITYYAYGSRPGFHKKYSKIPVFFIENSWNGTLEPHQVCAIESFARLNPQLQVVVVFTHRANKFDLYKDSRIAAVSENVENVHLTALDVSVFFDYKLLDRAANDAYLFTNIGQYLRLLIVHKLGGVSVDLDVLSVESVSSFLSATPHFVSFCDAEELKICMVGFANKYFVAKSLMAAMHIYSNTSSISIQAAVDKVSNRTFHKNTPNKFFRNVKMLRQKSISVDLPDKWKLLRQQRDRFFAFFSEEVYSQLNDTLSLHLVNHNTSGTGLNLKTGDLLAQKFCPVTFWNVKWFL